MKEKKLIKGNKSLNIFKMISDISCQTKLCTPSELLKRRYKSNDVNFTRRQLTSLEGKLMWNFGRNSIILTFG